MTRQEIIDQVKELRDVCSCFFCIVYETGQNELADMLCDYMESMKITKGFGLRASKLITRLEAGEKIDDR